MAIDASAPAPPAVSLDGRRAEIVAIARRILEAEGAGALTMRRLGDELSMKAPSLYKHVRGKGAIETALIEQAFVEVGQALRDAVHGLEPSDAVEPLLAAYRRLGRDNPNLYRLATVGPLDRAALRDGIEAWAAEPFALVATDVDVARALWSAAHGLVILEIDGRYPPDAQIDRAWAVTSDAFRAVLHKAGAPGDEGRGRRARARRDR